MEAYFNVIVFVLGTIIGSFLNVIIYRLHTGRSVNGRSHCMSCGETLTWYELFPVISYLALRARCRSCSAYIPYRYLVVEILMGLVFMGIFIRYGYDVPLMIFYAALASIFMVIAVYDLRHTIIPDECTLIVGAFALVKLIYTYVLTQDLGHVGLDIFAGIGAGAFLYGLWYVSRGKWIGLGDAKLALPLGVIAGSVGALSMVVLSFWIGAAISLVLLLLSYLLKKGKTVLHFIPGQLTMKSEVPFAPFLILGFICAHIFHADIFVITAFLIPLGT